MADFIAYWIAHLIKHVPFVTWVGLSMALFFIVLHLSKRWRECGLLAGVCVAYALAPYAALL